MAAPSAGRRLVEALSQPSDAFTITVLVVEAGRIADRLEKLDGILSGDVATWAQLLDGRDGVVEVRVDDALRHAGQQVTILRQVLGEIARQRSLTPSGDGPDDVLADL